MSCGVGCRHGSDLALLWLWQANSDLPLSLGTSICCRWLPKKTKKKKKKKKKGKKEKEVPSVGQWKWI